ncbi:MAG: hypothetical protein K0Q47_81 [Sedimentibacter sp.]|jgi:hypothetical protein|nr:hypothetical protein [Sedimentibacter sp.]
MPRFEKKNRNEPTVQELKDLFERMIDDGMGDHTVRLWHQPSWPFLLSIGKVATVYEEELDEDDPEYDENANKFVYLCEGRQLCYGPKKDELEEYGG